MEPDKSAIERAFELAQTGRFLEVWKSKTAFGMKATSPKLLRGLHLRLNDRGSPQHPMESAFPYIYRWNRCGRKGQACKVTARGSLNSARVEFEDGFVMITSRNALKRAT